MSRILNLNEAKNKSFAVYAREDATSGKRGRNVKHKSSNQGFASMVSSPDGAKRQREIASLGGHVAHQRGTAHEFTSEEAAKAGRIGGLRVSKGEAGRRHMAEIGRKGGRNSRRGSAKTDEISE